MERKLIKQGLGGFTIYLPKKWLDKKGLKEGNSVELIETDSNLIIGSKFKKNKSIEINITDENKKDLKNMLTHIYRKGYDKISLLNLNQNTIKEIKEITKELLLGMEITERTTNSCIMENIYEPIEQKYEVLLRRVFLLIKETENLIIQDFNNKKFENLQDINDIRNQLDKYVLFCRRILIKEKFQKNQILEWELLTFLTHINHAYFYLYKYVSSNNIKIEEKILKLLESSKSYFELLYEGYFKQEIKYIHKINLLKNKYHFGEIIEMLEKSKGKEIIILSKINEIFRIIQISSSPILSMLINSNLK